MEKEEYLIDKILKTWEGLLFTDVSGAKYEIFKKEYGYYHIRVKKEGVGEYKITNGPSPPILKAEWNSYCVKQEDGTFILHPQYLTNISMRGYIEVLKFGKSNP